MRTIPRPTGTPTPTPNPPAAPTRPVATPPVSTPVRPDRDPTVARAVLAVWSGDRATTVKSPPGGGKTSLITELAAELTQRAGLDVAAAAQTRAQAIDLANRAAEAGATVTLLGKSGSPAPAGLSAKATYSDSLVRVTGRRQVVVATTARWKNTGQTRALADVLLVDEAWQCVYADLCAIGDIAAQVALVGDPGQIAPVVTADTRRWQSWANGPHVPAPDGLLADHPGTVTELRIPHTWRLGPGTTSMLQDFYRESFVSRRPDSAVLLDGAEQPELAAQAIRAHPDPTNPALLDAVARRALALIEHGEVRTADGTRALRGGDLAVVVAHRNQAAYLSAALAKYPSVLVGTANQLQGCERHATVVLHPLAGRRDAPAFGLDPARLCVALSRHRSHATVITDAATPDVLDAALAADPGNDTARLHRTVLDTLNPHTNEVANQVPNM